MLCVNTLDDRGRECLLSLFLSRLNKEGGNLGRIHQALVLHEPFLKRLCEICSPVRSSEERQVRVFRTTAWWFSASHSLCSLCKSSPGFCVLA